jgi:glucuronosyltransferase
MVEYIKIDLLFSAHPNVKAFITSGGIRSLEEAVHYSVPIIGFPLLKPRKNFIAQITKFGAGEIVDPYQLDKVALKSIITEVVSNET